MATINEFYNYYLTSYGPKSLTRHDTHKKSELRNIYNQIIKLNKTSPLYKVDNTDSTRQYAIDIKESARSLKNVVSSLSANSLTGEDFSNRAAYSSDDDVVSVEYIDPSVENDVSSVSSFEIEVKKLAENQINLGNFLPADELGLSPDLYSFDLNVNQKEYEFQFEVTSNDTNKTIQDRLATLITNANVGLTAHTVNGNNTHSALELESVQTGITSPNQYIFSVSDEYTSKKSGVVDFLGINDVSQPPSNSSFLLNGIEKSSYSNTFTINKSFEINLNGVSISGQPTKIGFKTDIEAVEDNINQLVDAYNSTIDMAQKYSDSQPYGAKLLKDMVSIGNTYRNDIESIGLSVGEDGRISIDSGLLEQAFQENSISDNLSVLKDFKNSISAKAEKAMINPMEYVQKTLISYKNPARAYHNPYTTSIYSGMLFNNYC